MENLEMISFQIISCVGTAKSSYIEAARKAQAYEFDKAEELIKELMQYGLRGIEAYHRKHSPACVEYFSSMAENLGLIVTGGSDFHAPNIMNGQIILGKNFVPEWIYGMLIDEKKHLDMARD